MAPSRPMTFRSVTPVTKPPGFQLYALETSQPCGQAQFMPSEGGTLDRALTTYFWWREVWLAGAITIFMCLSTASRPVTEPGDLPPAGCQYSATEPAGGLVPLPAMSAQPMTVLPRLVTRPASLLMKAAYFAGDSSDAGTSSPPRW